MFSNTKACQRHHKLSLLFEQVLYDIGNDITKHFFKIFSVNFRNSTELWNGLGQSHIQALALAQDINVFFLVLLFGMFPISES